MSNELVSLLVRLQYYNDAQSHVEMHFINVLPFFTPWNSWFVCIYISERVRKVKCHVNIKTTTINLKLLFVRKVLLKMKNSLGKI